MSMYSNWTIHQHAIVLFDDSGRLCNLIVINNVTYQHQSSQRGVTDLLFYVLPPDSIVVGGVFTTSRGLKLLHLSYIHVRCTVTY